MTLDDTATWVIVVALAVGTYALRASFLLGIEWFDGLPAWLEGTLPYVPTAVLAALVAPELLVVDGSVAVTLGNEQLLAGLAAGVVAWYTENMIATVSVGMGTLWLLLWL